MTTTSRPRAPAGWARGRPTAGEPDRTLSLPGFCADAVRALLAAPETRVGDLPGLDPPDRLVLARRLLREAVAVPAQKR